MPESTKCWGSERLHLECQGHKERSWMSKAHGMGMAKTPPAPSPVYPVINQ